MPSAVSPTSASRSGIDAGGTPCLAITAGSSSVWSLKPVPAHDARAGDALAHVLVDGRDPDLRDGRIVAQPVRGGRDRVVGLELDHRPHHEAERRGGALGELELRDQRLGQALAGLVAGEQLVAERLDHVIERDARVRDRALAEHHGQAAHQAADRAHLAAAGLRRRGAEPRPEQLVGAVDEVNLHGRKATRYNRGMRATALACLALACASPRTPPMTKPASSLPPSPLPSPLAADAVAGVTDPALRAVIADHWST